VYLLPGLRSLPEVLQDRGKAWRDARSGWVELREGCVVTLFSRERTESF
jgi:hypothetical protein